MSPVCFVNHLPGTLSLLAPRFSVGKAAPCSLIWQFCPDNASTGARLIFIFRKWSRPNPQPLSRCFLKKIPIRGSQEFAVSPGDEYRACSVSSAETSYVLLFCNKARLQSCRKGRKRSVGFSPCCISSWFHPPFRTRRIFAGTRLIIIFRKRRKEPITPYLLWNFGKHAPPPPTRPGKVKQ
jgi:hypothetical protein